MFDIFLIVRRMFMLFNYSDMTNIVFALLEDTGQI